MLIGLLLGKSIWLAECVSEYADGGINCLCWSYLFKAVWSRRTGFVDRSGARCVAVSRLFSRCDAGFFVRVPVGLAVRG